ncbi:MAG: hypothetical protein ABWK05_04860 [Pyrobaculum sp.]
MNTLFEIAGEVGKLLVVEDPEVGHVFAIIPINGRVSPATLREVREQTLDYWRYVEGVGLVLDLTAWWQESGMSLEDVKNKVEGKYKEIIDEVYKLVEESRDKESKAKKSKKKRSKKRRGAKRRRRRT